ncbi:unnamed protein product [Linum trigynum]|uniref:Uncharacterized protein n=1 Tax=Linum trigynum TaxID=586398 RepID=A0AAV2EBQ9_9ROSI
MRKERENCSRDLEETPQPTVLLGIACTSADSGNFFGLSLAVQAVSPETAAVQPILLRDTVLSIASIGTDSSTEITMVFGNIFLRFLPVSFNQAVGTLTLFFFASLLM